MTSDVTATGLALLEDRVTALEWILKDPLTCASRLAAMLDEPGRPEDALTPVQRERARALAWELVTLLAGAE